jgi:hypothetical protein
MFGTQYCIASADDWAIQAVDTILFDAVRHGDMVDREW